MYISDLYEDELEISIKVVIVGNGAVGKSSMIQRYCRGIFTNSYKKTIGVDFLEKQLRIGGEEVRLMLWDTAGQEEFDAITKAYYRGAQACVVGFSTTDRLSFEAVRKWKKKVEDECGPVPMVLVQNKIDLMHEAEVSPDEVERLAKECKMRLYRTSVKEDLNVSGVFQHLAENYVNKVKSFTDSNNSGYGGVNGGGGTGVGGNSETFQIGASSRQNFSGNSHYVTNNNSRGPLYITKPPPQHGLHAANNGNTPQNSRNGFNQLSRNGNGGNGYIPSVYSNNPNTRPSSNRVISTQNGLHGHQRYHHFSTNVSSSFSPQDYLNNPMFDSLNNQRTHRYWPHNSSSDRGTITLRPLTSKKLTTSGALHRKMMGPRSACKVLS